MKRIILSGFYGFNNAGDEAILAALIAGLEEKFSKVEIIVLSANPKFSTELHNVKAISRLNFKKLIHHLKESDLLISGGGSLLQDITSLKTIPYYLGVIALAKLFKVPVYFCAQGVGPIKSSLNQSLVAHTLNKVDLITVRDQKSKELLKKLGVEKKIRVTADLVFNLSKSDNKVVANILNNENINLSSRVVGIAVRPWANNSYLKKLALILDKLKEKLDLQLLLVPFHHPYDLNVSYTLQELMNNKVELLEGNYSPQQVLGIVSNLDLMIGIRLHSLIFSALVKVPIAGISYDPKIDNFLAQLDLTAVANINQLQVKQTYQRIFSIWNNKTRQKNMMIREVERISELAESNFDLAQQKFGD